MPRGVPSGRTGGFFVCVGRAGETMNGMTETATVRMTKRIDGGICAPMGFAAAGVRCGIKRKRRDIALIACASPVAAAGVFTTNVVRAPCVDRDERILAERPYVRGIVVNAGNANAGNGENGEQDNERMAVLAAHALGCAPEQILTASTGVIGSPMPMEIVASGIADAGHDLASSAQAAANAAEAILTTDTFDKQFAVEFDLGGHTARIGGIAKGSGMIAPNMATMLAFLTTDIAISPALLDS